MLLNKR